MARHGEPPFGVNANEPSAAYAAMHRARRGWLLFCVVVPAFSSGALLQCAARNVMAPGGRAAALLLAFAALLAASAAVFGTRVLMAARRHEQRVESTGNRQLAQLRELLLGAPAIVTVTRGPEHELQFLNRAAEQLLGYRKVIGSPLLDALPTPDTELVRLHDEVIATGRPYLATELGFSADFRGQGLVERKTFHVVCQPWADQDASPGVITFAFDVTEQVTARKRAEDLARDLNRADEERERLLAMVGHDLRNPLNVVTLGAEMLLAQDLPENARHLVRRIGKSGRRADVILAQLLDYAQIRHGGGVDLSIAAGDLGQIAESLVEELRLLYPDSEIRLHTSGNLCGDWDIGRLQQVVSNLLSNALQHGTAKRPIRINIRGHRGGVSLQIENGGALVPELDRASLFDPFRRGSSRSGSRNLGLGLYIVREIVLAHGGKISVSSSQEHDTTTFTVDLPRSAEQSGIRLRMPSEVQRLASTPATLHTADRGRR